MHVLSGECITNWKEWLCVIDDELRILPWQTPSYGVAYSCSHILLLECLGRELPLQLQFHLWFQGLWPYKWGLCAYVIAHTILPLSSHFVNRAGWQAKMDSIEFWIPWCNTHAHFPLARVFPQLCFHVECARAAPWKRSPEIEVGF